MAKQWPDHLPVVQVRIARPTGQPERVAGFYRDGLGLPTEGIFGGEYEYGAVVWFELQGGLKLAAWLRSSISLKLMTRERIREPT